MAARCGQPRPVGGDHSRALVLGWWKLGGRYWGRRGHPSSFVSVEKRPPRPARFGEPRAEGNVRVLACRARQCGNSYALVDLAGDPGFGKGQGFWRGQGPSVPPYTRETRVGPVILERGRFE